MNTLVIAVLACLGSLIVGLVLHHFVSGVQRSRAQKAEQDAQEAEQTAIQKKLAEEKLAKSIASRKHSKLSSGASTKSNKKKAAHHVVNIKCDVPNVYYAAPSMQHGTFSDGSAPQVLSCFMPEMQNAEAQAHPDDKSKQQPSSQFAHQRDRAIGTFPGMNNGDPTGASREMNMMVPQYAPYMAFQEANPSEMMIIPMTQMHGMYPAHAYAPGNMLPCHSSGLPQQSWQQQSFNSYLEDSRDYGVPLDSYTASNPRRARSTKSVKVTTRLSKNALEDSARSQSAIIDIKPESQSRRNVPRK